MELTDILFLEHPTPMLLFNCDTLEILQANKEAINRYGYSEKEFLDLTLRDLYAEEDRPLDHTEDSEFTEERRQRHLTKNGDVIYVQITVQKLPQSEDHKAIAHLRDITEKVELETELEHARKADIPYIESQPLAMAKYDHNFRVIEWSERAEKGTGHSQKEIIGTSLFDDRFVPADKSDELKSFFKRIASGQTEKGHLETAILSKKGKRMEVQMYASALRDHEDRLKSVLVFLDDIREEQVQQQQLRQREEKYHQLFEFASDGMILLDDMKIIDCNEQIERIFSANKGDIIGKTPITFSPENQPCGIPSLKKAREYISKAKSGSKMAFTWKHVTPEGELKDVEVSLNDVKIGKNRYIQAILRDLTEQKKVKEKLSHERDRLRQAQQLAGIGWWSYNVEKDRLVWSDILYDMLGVDKENFDNNFEAFFELIHPEDQEKFKKYNDRARKTAEPLAYTIRINRGDNNETIYLKCRSKSEFDNNGNLVRIHGVDLDITERKKTERNLRKREKMLECLFFDSPAAVAMVDAEGKVQNINTSFENLFGYSKEELMVNELLKFQLPQDRHHEINSMYKKIFSQKDGSHYFEDQLCTKSGETKDLLIGGIPISVDEDSMGAFVIYTDITDLRSAEENLQESIREKETLLAEIHHRVKNNLAIINGLLELESMNWDEESSVYKVLNQSKLRIHSMARVHEKLYQSKNFRRINLNSYIPELLDTIYSSMYGGAKDVSVSVDCDEISLNINQAITCGLIINELVTNAFKYAFDADRRGTLDVTLHAKDEIITLVVADNGPGLPYSFDKMTKQSLGHQLVNQLVKQLEGTIEVDSSPQEGTRYEINFIKSDKKGSSGSHLI